MSATSIFNKCSFTKRLAARFLGAFCALTVIFCQAPAQAGDKGQAEDAAHVLARNYEKDGFEFRADSWVKVLRPDMGKAVRIQLFKGNDYRFCIAVPADSGVRITATVLDFDGNPTGKTEAVAQGWGVVVSVKPRKTGAYAVAIRQLEDGKPREVPCAVITGWK